MDSNHRPPAYQADALTCWAISPYRCQMADDSSQTLLTFSCYLTDIFLASSTRPLFSALNCFNIRSGISALRFVQAKCRLGCRASRLVEIIGIEPMTPCLQSRCSPSWAIPPYYWVFNVLFHISQCLALQYRSQKPYPMISPAQYATMNPKN